MEKKSAKKILKLTKTIECLTNENRELHEELEKHRYLLENYSSQYNKKLDAISFVKPPE